MANSAVFTNDRAQAVRLPGETRFPIQLKELMSGYVVKNELLRRQNPHGIAFFLATTATEDFMAERASQ